MELDWLETTYWPEDFKKEKDFMEYCICVAKHELKEVFCKNCTKNFYLDIIKKNELNSKSTWEETNKPISS